MTGNPTGAPGGASLRVAIYHPWVYLRSGLERTLMELKRRSRHDWTILTSHYDPEGTYPELKAMGVRELNRVSVNRRYGTVLRAAVTILKTKLDPEAYDVLFISCDGLGSLLNFRNHDKPVASLCFTPLRAVYDEAYRERHLEQNRRLLPFALLFEWGYRVIDRRAWRYYDRVFCISETVRDRVLRGMLCSPERIQVAYPGIDGDRIAASEVFEPFFFLPGRIMWTKNLELGIKAFHRALGRTGKDFRLVIAGMVDAKSREYFDRLKAIAGNSLAIEFVIAPSDDIMHDLYRRCYATLFTAFNEDLGLTPLEAMTVGKPTIAVNRGGPREIVTHEETGLLAEGNVDAFAEAMVRLMVDPELVRRLGRNGVERAREFTWEAYVGAIDRYLDETAAHASECMVG